MARTAVSVGLVAGLPVALVDHARAERFGFDSEPIAAARHTMIVVTLRVLPSRRATLTKLAAKLGPVRTFGTRARAAILGCAGMSPERPMVYDACTG
jgi:hypothetical protein